MFWLNKNKNLVFSFILIIFLIGGFFVRVNRVQAIEPVVAPAAPAAGTTETAQTTTIQTGTKTNEPKEWNLRFPVVFHIIGIILFLILKLLNSLVWLGANLADKILNITSFTKVNVVTIGWGITRSIANMFFALILLVMSISTILQIDSFSYKILLKRLVIVALLINFSLVFAGIIIDFSQIMASYFLSAGAGGEGGNGISANLTNGLKIVNVYNFSNTQQSFFSKVADVVLGPSLQMIVEMFMAIILFMAAAFSFFAMSFFLIARIVWIWLLLIAAPIAWVSYIVPNAPGQLGGLWGQWWSKFLSWTLFAPIYAFFLYLALTIAKYGVTLDPGPWGAGLSGDDKALQSGFFASPATVLQYIVMIMIMLGGLKIAQSMSITGASGAMNIVNKAGKWAGNKAKGAAKSPFSYAYDATAAPAMAKVGNWLKESKYSPIKKLGYRASGKAGQMQDKVNATRGDKLKGISDEGQMYMAEHSMGPNKRAALETLNKSGALAKDYKDPAQQAQARGLTEQAINAYRSVGREKEAKDLEELKPDAINNAAKRKEAIDRAVLNGNWKKWNASVMEGPNGKDIMNDLQEKINNKEISQPDFNDTFKGWGKRMKEAAETQMKASFDDKFTVGTTDGDANIARRQTFASATGKLDTAFHNPTTGTLEVAVAQPYISKMSAPQVASIYDSANLDLIGKNATPAQLDSIVRSLNGYQKTQMKAGAIASGNQTLINHVNNSLGWQNV